MRFATKTVTTKPNGKIKASAKSAEFFRIGAVLPA